jgi:hypothetical protein
LPADVQLRSTCAANTRPRQPMPRPVLPPLPPLAPPPPPGPSPAGGPSSPPVIARAPPSAAIATMNQLVICAAGNEVNSSSAPRSTLDISDPKRHWLAAGSCTAAAPRPIPGIEHKRATHCSTLHVQTQLCLPQHAAHLSIRLEHRAGLDICERQRHWPIWQTLACNRCTAAHLSVRS